MEVSGLGLLLFLSPLFLRCLSLLSLGHSIRALMAINRCKPDKSPTQQTITTYLMRASSDILLLLPAAPMLLKLVALKVVDTASLSSSTTFSTL